MERRKIDLVERSVCKRSWKNGFPIHQPINKLTKEQYKQLWKGTGKALGIDDFLQM